MPSVHDANRAPTPQSRIDYVENYNPFELRPNEELKVDDDD